MKYLLLAFSVFLLFTTCKKYPDGGYTKRGPKNIIGNWKLTLYEVNGIDSTDLINYNGDDKYKIVKIYKDGSVINISLNGSIVHISNFINKNQILHINGTENSSLKCIAENNVNYCFRKYFTPESNQVIDWSIEKLTNKEIILNCKLINNYKIKLNINS
jgi:hypothetical protein